jgi:hypothetical protein
MANTKYYMDKAPGQKRGRRAFKYFKDKNKWGAGAFPYLEEPDAEVKASDDFASILKDFDSISNDALFPAYAIGSVTKKDIVRPHERLAVGGGHDGLKPETDRVNTGTSRGYSSMGVDWYTPKTGEVRQKYSTPRRVERVGDFEKGRILGDDYNYNSYGKKILAKKGDVVRTPLGKVEYMERTPGRVEALAEQLTGLAPIGPLYSGPSVSDEFPEHQDSPEENLTSGFRPEVHHPIEVKPGELEATGIEDVYKSGDQMKFKAALRKLGLRPADIPLFYARLDMVNPANRTSQSFYNILGRAVKHARARDVSEEANNMRPTRMQSDIRVKENITAPRITHRAIYPVRGRK